MLVLHPGVMANTVLVTGGAKRIGREICLRLAREGFDVAIHYRDSESEASDLVAQIEKSGVRASAFQCDLSDSGETKSLIGRVRETLGPVSGLVNNASVFQLDRLETLEEETWDEHMKVNTLAPLILIRELADEVDEEAWVVNILDFKVSSPNGDYLSYTSSRYALHGLTSALAVYLAPIVRVNAIAPGHVLPSRELTEEALNSIHAHSLLGRGPSSEEVAETVAFLSGSRSITGQTIFVDAGERFNQRRQDPAFGLEE